VSHGTHAEAYVALAGVLSANPTLYRQLLREHPETGDCTGCMLPGSHKTTAAPCSIRTLAEMARDFRLRR
jgi:hypothetical protein